MKNNLRVKIFEKYNYNLLSKDVIGKYDIKKSNNTFYKVIEYTLFRSVY